MENDLSQFPGRRKRKFSE